MRGIRVLVTAGPTREFFDPVRFLSNPSSGRMGYALAEEAARRGARVALISGPVRCGQQSAISGQSIRRIAVVSAKDMHRAVMKEAPRADIILMAAAVSDYRPAGYSKRKIKKRGQRLILSLMRTPDILKELGRRKRPGQILVGFAAETDHLKENALKKLRLKTLDWIVANQVGVKEGGFGSESNRALLLSSRGHQKRLPLTSKKKMAKAILDFI